MSTATRCVTGKLYGGTTSLRRGLNVTMSLSFSSPSVKSCLRASTLLC